MAKEVEDKYSLNISATEEKHRFLSTLPCKFLEHYMPVELLGEGEMGIVLKVKNRRIGQMYAAKIATDNNYRQRLKQEGERLKELNHRVFPYIVDFMETEHFSILIMEYIEGISLEEYLEKHTPLTETEAVCKILEIAEILSILHHMHPKIIYQDLKPSNLMIQPDGKLRLIDFGTALCGHLFINTEYYMGTNGYSAPEQRSGKNITEKTDIYSLGALFSYMVSGVDPGKPPFLIADPGQEAILISSKVRKLIRDCCEEEPDKRIANTEELIRCLKKKSCENFVCNFGKAVSYLMLILLLVYTYLYLFHIKLGIPILIISSNTFMDLLETALQPETFHIAAIFICIVIICILVLSNKLEKSGFIRKRKVNIVCSEKRTKGL